jgi:NitT/TauT family transport system substrate-binding protein
MKKSMRGALVAGVIVAAVPQVASAQNQKAIVSAAFKSVFYLPAYVAEERGFFKKEGLDVRIDVAGSSTVALAAVISKSADFSLHGPEWTAISAMRGGTVEVVGGTLDGLGAWLICKPDVKFSSMASLKGLTVVTGAMPTTSSSVFLTLLKKDGIDAKKDLTVMEVPLGNEVGPLLAGQAACGVMYEPGASQAEAQGLKVVLAFPQLMGSYTFSAISTRKDIDPVIAQKFVNAMDMALKDIRANPDAAVASGIKLFPNLPAPVVKAAVERLIRDKVFADSVAIKPEAMKAALQTQVDLANLPSIPPDATFMNMGFADKVAK